MPTFDIEFDPNGSLEDWDWLKPEDLELFTVSDEEFELRQNEFWQGGDRLDARKGLVKKKQRVQGEKGAFERTYWVKPNVSAIPAKVATPRDRQRQEHYVLNIALQDHPLVKTAKPEVAAKVKDLSLEMKRRLSMEEDRGNREEMVDVNSGSSFITLKSEYGNIRSIGRIMGKEIQFVTDPRGSVEFFVDRSHGADKGLEEKDKFEKIRDKRVAHSIKGMWKSQIAQMDDGKHLFCSPADGDGRKERRSAIYQRMGFSKDFMAVVDKLQRKGVRPVTAKEMSQRRSAEEVAREQFRENIQRRQSERQSEIDSIMREGAGRRFNEIFPQNSERVVNALARTAEAGGNTAFSDQDMARFVQEAREYSPDDPIRVLEEHAEMIASMASEWEEEQEEEGRLRRLSADSLSPTGTMTQSKANYIADKHGFAKGVASEAYLLAFDSAAAICDRRYGWKKGAGGKCERIKPQKATMQQGDRPQGGSNRTMLTIGLGALATGVVGGAIGGTILANNAAQKQFDLERQELQETYKKNSDKQINDFREKHEAQKSVLEKDLSEAEGRFRDLQETAKQDKGKLEDLQKELIEIEQNHKTVASERDQAIADLDKANKAIAEKESVIESLSKGSEGIADIEEKMKAAQQELEAERSKTATLQATAKEKEDAFKEASQKLEEAQNTIKATGEAYATAKSEAEKEKKRFNELSQAIDKDSRDVKDLTKKVEALKVAQKKAQENGEKLAIANEKISDLELTQRNLNDRILSVQTEKELKVSELQEKAKELEDLRATTTVGIGDRDQQISQLQSSLNEGARTVAKLRQSEAEAKSKLKESEQLLIQEQKKANAVQSALNKQEKQVIALEQELGITRKETEQQIEAIHRKHQAEVAKLYEGKAQILSASPETFNRKKLRRSSDAQLSGVLSYSIEDGMNQDDLQPGSRFWAAKDATKEKAVVKAAERIIELEEERIQANVAKKVAQQIKETPLAMSTIGGEKQVANMRKRSADLATATALTRSIADPTTLVESDKGLPMNRKQTWRSMASDIWDPRSEGSPTPQLLENEALLAEAKLRDVYVFSQSKAIRRQAQESYKEVLSSDLPPEQKAEQFKSIHQAMMQAIKQMEATATGSQDNLFAAIKRDIEGRKDSAKRDVDKEIQEAEERSRKERAEQGKKNFESFKKKAAIGAGIVGGALAYTAVDAGVRAVGRSLKNARCKKGEIWVNNPEVKGGGYCRSQKEVEGEKATKRKESEDEWNYIQSRSTDEPYVSYGEHLASEQLKKNLTPEEKSIAAKSGKEQEKYISDLTRGIAAKDRAGVNDFWTKKIAGKKPMNDYGTDDYMSPFDKQWAQDKGLEKPGSKTPHHWEVEDDLERMGLKKMIQMIKDETSVGLFSDDRYHESSEWKVLETKYYGKNARSDAKEKGKKAAEEKIAKVMSEFKDGKLKSSSGGKVKNRKQAIAIALPEAKRQYATPKP